MDNLIKNLNYSAEETNDILASVATKASNIALQEVKQNVVNISEYIEEYEADTNTKFEELKVTIDSFQENLTTLSTNLTTLSDSFTEKYNKIEDKFTEINSKISSTEESINSNIEGINDNIVGLKTQLQTTDSNINDLLAAVRGLTTKIEEKVDKSDLEAAKQELLLEIEKLNNRLDIFEALETPDNTLVDSEGNIFATKDRNYFITKQLN